MCPSAPDSSSGPREVKALPRPKKTSSLRPRMPRSTLRDKPAEGSQVAGRYRLERVLGKGGMGSVWAAWDDELERLVAIKFMASEIAENRDLRDRFNREAKAAARLRTRHVTQVFDFGVDGRTPFIVMEFLEGEDLRTCLKRTKRLPLKEVARILVQTARALRRAQDAGIVHRDLKPANVFLAHSDDEAVVKILDFGVAKTKASKRTDSTKSGVVLGSPPYLSPEQARGLPLDHRSDLWSLAALAYRCLTGSIPFDGNTDADVVVKICTEEAPPPSTLVRRLPPTVDAFFAKAFMRKPDDRYQTATELAAAFSAAIGDAARGADSSGGYTPLTSDPFYATTDGQEMTLTDTPSSVALLEEKVLQGPPPVPTDSELPPTKRPPEIPSVVPTPEPWSGDSAESLAPEGLRGRRRWGVAAVAAVFVVAGGLLAFANYGGDSDTDGGVRQPAAGDTAPIITAVATALPAQTATAASKPTSSALLATTGSAATGPAASASASSTPPATATAAPPPVTAVRPPPPPPKPTSTGTTKKPTWGY